MFIIDKENGSYRFTIFYSKGGYNYFDNSNRPRGYRLYVERFIKDGDFSKVLAYDPENMMIFLEEAKRFSQKKEDKLNEILDKYKEELVELYFSDREKFVKRIFEIFKGE